MLSGTSEVYGHKLISISNIPFSSFVSELKVGKCTCPLTSQFTIQFIALTSRDYNLNEYAGVL